MVACMAIIDTWDNSIYIHVMNNEKYYSTSLLRYSFSIKPNNIHQIAWFIIHIYWWHWAVIKALDEIKLFSCIQIYCDTKECLFFNFYNKDIFYWVPSHTGIRGKISNDRKHQRHATSWTSACYNAWSRLLYHEHAFLQSIPNFHYYCC